MIVAFGVIGLLILFLIYFVLRAQNLQKELALLRHSNKQTNNKVTYAYRNLVLVTDALEKNLTARIESAYKSRLIDQTQYNALHPLMRNFSTIVMACCEKGMSFEESLNKVLLNEEVTLEEIREVVKLLQRAYGVVKKYCRQLHCFLPNRYSNSKRHDCKGSKRTI